ncbi:MAG: hypothetical protein PVF49_09660 [Anaerolineales bacterium]|jgi:hypothetical protein
MATQILTGLPAEELVDHWHPSKVPDVNRELHNAVRLFVGVYGIQPTKTKHGDLARLVRLILVAADMLDDPTARAVFRRISSAPHSIPILTPLDFVIP